MKRACLAVAAMLVMAASSSAQTPQYTPIGPGAWQIEIVRDPMTDQTRATAVLISEARNAGVIVRCESGGRRNQVIFAVEFDTYLGFSTEPNQDAMIRFDDLPPHQMRWYYDDKTIQQTDQRRAAILVSASRVATRMAVRALVWNLPRHHTIDATFDLTGGREAIDAAYAACGMTVP